MLVTGLDAAGQRWLARLDGSRERARRAPGGRGGGRARRGGRHCWSAPWPRRASSTTRPRPARRGRRCRRWSASGSAPTSPRSPSSIAVPTAGSVALAGRLAATVEVRGAGRVGASVATLLAAAGVGRVLVTDHEPTRPGRPRARGPEHPRPRLRPRRSPPPAPRGGGGRVRRGAHFRRPRGPRPGAARRRGARCSSTVRDALIAALRPAPRRGRARDDCGVVGPLVRPGQVVVPDVPRPGPGRPRPGLAAAWSPSSSPNRRRRPGGCAPCDAVLATTVAGHAVLQALTFLDGGMPSTVDGTLEIALPEGTLRRRSWQRHPACGCAWADESMLVSGASLTGADGASGSGGEQRIGSIPHNGCMSESSTPVAR